MRFGKTRMFLVLNGIIAIFLVIHFSTWLLSPKTIAAIVPPYNANTISVQYEVEGNTYMGKHLRNEIPFYQKTVEVHYYLFNPAKSRIISYLGLFAEPLGWWLVFLLASSMLLLMPNTVFSTGTMFQLQKKFPWISMDEYFPAPAERYSREQKQKAQPVPKPKRLEENKRTKT